VSNTKNPVSAYVVLVVEDEFLIRVIAVEALLNAGFVVLEAGHAGDALAILQSRATDIHALFTDVQMPGDMDGVMLAHETSRCWPWIGLLITSGCTPLAQTALPAGSRSLPKPYDVDHVVRHIHALVSG
jgi:two-component system, response regulator PdtaR